LYVDRHFPNKGKDVETLEMLSETLELVLNLQGHFLCVHKHKALGLFLNTLLDFDHVQYRKHEDACLTLAGLSLNADVAALEANWNC